MGIYAYAQQSGIILKTNILPSYATPASMTTEELAQKHLNVDLTQPDFGKPALIWSKRILKNS